MSEPIRIAHFSDTHLGYRAYGKPDPKTGRNQRTVDVENAFADTIDAMVAAKPDLIIHSGDVFHHSRPSWHAIRHFVRLMRRIELAKIPTLVIAGNHDTPRLRTDGSVYSVLELALPEIRFVAEYELVTETKLLEERNVRIQALPHGALTNDDPPFTRVAQGKRNILVSHGVVPGVMPEQAHGEPGEKYLDTTLLDPEFDYIALGHYHVHAAAGARAWYAGATERFGFGDRDAAPGWTLVELGDPGEPPTVTHMPIATRPMISLPVFQPRKGGAREMADHILGKLQALEQPEAMVSIALRDFERPARREIESIVRREAGEFVWLAYFVNDRAQLLNAAIERDPVQTTDLRALFAQFVQEKTGNTMTPDFAQRFLERGGKALDDAIQQAQAADEGDAA